METTAISNNEHFSIFPSGWWDERDQKVKPRQHPQQTQDIAWVHQYITSERARWATESLRAMQGATREEKQAFKALHFEYATFSGIFSYRNARSLVTRSPFVVLDIDGLDSTGEARALQQTFIRDRELQTALCFVSPKGLGVKWVVRLPAWTQGLSFRQQFNALRDYVGFTYGVDPDNSGSDVCRACYLPWDPECFMNQRYVSL